MEELLSTEPSTNLLDSDSTNVTVVSPSHIATNWILFYIFLLPVFLLGLVGNGVVLFVFIHRKDIRTSPNIILFNLALADFMTLFFCATAPAYDFLGHVLPVICPVIRLLMEVTMHGSGFSMVTLSIERYYAIARPFRTKGHSTTFVRYSVMFSWLGGLTLSLVKFFLQTPGDSPECVRMIDTNKMPPTYAIVCFVISYIAPLTVIAMFYILMARELLSSGKLIQQHGVALRRQFQLRKRLAFRVLLLVIAYAVCFLPYHLFSLRVHLLEDVANVEEAAYLINVLYCIGCTHISLNPFILYFLSTRFREYFNKYLFCCFIKQNVLLDNSSPNHQNEAVYQTSAIS